MSFGQSDTLSYESIMDYYNRKTNMIEFYQTAGNNDKAKELTKERDGYIDALKDSYGKGQFYSALSDEYNELGDYINAKILCRKATNIYKKVLGPNHFTYIISLSNLAYCTAATGDFIEAINLEKESLTIREYISGTNNRDYAASLCNLASYYSELDNYLDAIRYAKEAKEIFEMINGKEDSDYATLLGILASCYYELGNYSEAIRLGKETLEIQKKVNGEEHLFYSIALIRLARFYFSLGNYADAFICFKKASENIKNDLGPKHHNYAASLDDLVNCYKISGNYSDALLIATEEKEIYRESLGSLHPDYARALHSLADIYYHLDNCPEAINLEKESMSIIKNLLGTENHDYATSLCSLADYNFELGNYSEAIQLSIEGMKIIKKIFGTDHYEYATSLSNLASFYYDLGNNSEAWTYEKQSFDIMQNYILFSFSELYSGLQESLWLYKHAPLFNVSLPSSVYRYQIKESISELYDKAALFAKGILLNTSIAMRKQILESGDAALISKYDALVANKSVLEKQLNITVKERYLNLDSLRSVIQDMEIELARDSKAYGDFTRNLRINWKDVEKKLGSGDIAIEFLDFPLVGSDSTMYVALTLKKGYESPHMTTLFEKRQLKAISEELFYTNTDLYDLIWKPLEEEFSGVKNIYFSPSGELHRIGIEYVPITMTENVCDKYNLHRLSSTRQLAYIQDETKGDKSVLYGGLKYEAAVSDTIPAPPSSKVNRGFTFVPRAIVDSLDIRGSFKYLPGTKEEADRIASNLDSYSIPYKYYYGTEGTEESFKSLDGSKPKTLHIATHGFYMTEQDAEKKNFARLLFLEESRGCREDKPMTRSGLLLSGCSRALNHETIPEGKEDGILTADEISKLDLRGLDLVVLSACQTGLGDIASGEGVFGLQRGFKNAGAKTIIMSLWNVSDIATQHLMTSFYNHYLSGIPKEQSFRMAQEELRKLIDSGQKRPDWAAFVMLDGL